MAAQHYVKFKSLIALQAHREPDSTWKITGYEKNLLLADLRDTYQCRVYRVQMPVSPVIAHSRLRK